jgi:putative hydrolase of the HAD superfamily
LKPILDGKRAVIFDLFHTLVEVRPEAGNGRYTPDILGIDRKRWNEVLWNDTDDRVLGIDRDPVSIIRKAAHRIDPSIPEHAIVEAAQSRLKRFETALEAVDPATVESLAALRSRGFKIGLISNADVTEIAAWPRSPLAPHFHSAVFSCYVGLKKPDAAIYEHSLSELGVTAEEAVFVGDGGSDELKGARAVTLTTVMMAGIIRKSDPHLLPARAQFADHTVERVAELLG